MFWIASSFGEFCTAAARGAVGEVWQAASKTAAIAGAISVSRGMRISTRSKALGQNGRMRRLAWVLFVTIASLLASSHGAEPEAASYAQARERTALLREAGRRIFLDPAFSSSGKQSCASCHDPARRYSPPNSQDVQMGGPALRDQGL